jgi:hypothetical protein
MAITMLATMSAKNSATKRYFQNRGVVIIGVPDHEIQKSLERNSACVRVTVAMR